MGLMPFNLHSGDGKWKTYGLLCALSGLVLTLIGNYIFFFKMDTAYKTLPVLLLGYCFSGAAMKLGFRKLGVLSIVLSLPAAGISLIIIIFFALGGTR